MAGAADVALRTAVGGCIAGAGLAALNRSTVRSLTEPDAPITEPVTVCIPARDEAHRLPALLADLRAQTGLDRLRVLVLDDDSADGTYELAVAATADDPRLEVRRDRSGPPAGSTGKAAACQRLAESAPVEGVLVFIDADLRLRPGAVAAAVAALREDRVAVLSAWPSQAGDTPIERLVQPLLCWSWASTLPILVANRSLRPSTAVACGQFLVVDAASYRAMGGHAAVAASATEDVELARAMRRSGRRTAVRPAAGLAHCRMYCGRAELDAGYRRWLWSAYGSPAGSLAVAAAAALLWLAPPLAALFGGRRSRRWGLCGYGAAITGRMLARSIESDTVGGSDLVAAAAHPVAVLAYARLSLLSHRAQQQGRLRWKGRELVRAQARTGTG